MISAMAPTTPDTTSAQTDPVAQASTTATITPITCTLMSMTVTRPSIRWRFAVSIRVGRNPVTSRVSAATGRSSRSIGSP